MQLNSQQETIMLNAHGLGTIGFEAETLSDVLHLEPDRVIQDSEDLVRVGQLKLVDNRYVDATKPHGEYGVHGPYFPLGKVKGPVVGFYLSREDK
jgi:hypothetical protein